MKVYATKTEEVVIKPIDVINKLIEKEYDFRKGYSYEKDGRYFIHKDTPLDEEITRDKYEYITSLKCVRNYLSTYDV